MRELRSTLTWLALASFLAVGPPSAGADDETPARAPGTVRFEGNPDGLGAWRLEPAFPALTFDRPVWVGNAADGSDRVFVAERAGLVRSFENRRDVDATRDVLDLRKKVSSGHNEEGLLGVAFDPAFRKSRRVYVTYTTDDPPQVVVSRFLATGSGLYVRPNTEQVLFGVRQNDASNNGGGLAFGPDGFLYLGLGDGGLEGDPRGQAQDLTTLLGSIVRIDVSPRKSFAVPNDNPFTQVRGARPEIWAYGFHDPRRLAFDRVTGELWVADRGQDRVEELNVVQRGGNHGWNLREGRQVFAEGASLVPLLDPVLEVPRAEARRLTGGVVYRGRRLPALDGAYVYADVETGNVWALRWDGSLVRENRLLARGLEVSAIGEDEAGELLLATLDGRLHTLVEGGAPSERPFPRRLSDTGLFTDVKAGVPDPALIPYEVNTPLWSDGAGKQRWMMLPGLERIHVREDGTFEWPTGSLFVKSFHLGAGDGPDRRLETRVLVREASGWTGYTYVWNEAQDDAVLIDGSVTLALPAPSGVDAEYVDWTFPSRSDCMSCHTEVANRVLGFRPEQLRAPDGGPGQLAALAALDLFDAPLPETGPAWPVWDPGTEPADLDRSVRAYLEANCAMCHQPSGPGNASIDLRASTPLEGTRLVGTPPGQWDLGVYGARLLQPGQPRRSLLLLRMERTDAKGMPTISHGVPDEAALERIARWIEGLAR